jgi:hypothetical protein
MINFEYLLNNKFIIYNLIVPTTEALPISLVCSDILLDVFWILVNPSRLLWT